ncbi:hypothetical protein EJ06DRAFT_355070 [Trichodelitschia bisporula]|uniref:Uncharacterized protein n=1 Tax=Trichodelitschia bisporula TaxID=703511 RepID=A0A6G1I128_9PEZI|nr:hypothetical protein EJ06DRAFT_355070 [Trichodelitschia bisporula]
MMRSSILAAAAVSIVGVLADSHNNSSSIALASSPSISASTTSVDPSKPCKGWNVLVTPAVVSYPSDVVEYSSTLTATVIPHITEYADGSRHTSWTTVMVAPNATTTIPYSSPKNEPLVWTEYGYTLTYPNTYIAFSDVRGGPNILPPATSAPSVVFRPGATCAQNITSVSLQATSTFLFPLATADPAHTTAAASSLLAVLNDTPGVLSQFNGTNMKDCTLSIDGTRTVKLAPITAAAVTKVSVAVLQQTAQAVITRVSDTAPSDGKDKPADAQDAGAKDQASPAAAAAPTSVGLGDLIASALGMARPVADAPAPTNGVKIGSETYALAPAPNGAVAFGSYTLPAGAATSINAA